MTLVELWAERSWLIKSGLLIALLALTIQALCIVRPEYAGRHEYLMWLGPAAVAFFLFVFVEFWKYRLKLFRLIRSDIGRRVLDELPPVEAPVSIKCLSVASLIYVVLLFNVLSSRHGVGAPSITVSRIEWVDGSNIARQMTDAEYLKYNVDHVGLVSAVSFCMATGGVWLAQTVRQRRTYLDSKYGI